MADFQQGEYKEAVEFFKQKINLPTATYKDLAGAMHSRAFAVAGAMRDDILSDFRGAIEKAIASGSTLQEFRKTYNGIADKWAADDPGFREKRTGKSYDAWRSKVIYSTNMATAYAAGRESQMRDPVMKDIWQHARYRSMMDGRERPEHALWNNVVLPINDPWWSTHTPPNGWNCRCWVEPVSATELEILREEGVRLKEGLRLNPSNTKGIDEGWDHNVGESNFGILRREGRQWATEEQQGLWSGTPEPLNLQAIDEKRLYSLQKPTSAAEFKDTLDKALATKDGVATFSKNLVGNTYSYFVDTKYFVGHLEESRSRFAGMIAETIKNPQEIRAEFMKSNTGKVAIRHLFYSKFNDDGTGRYIKVVFDANEAKFVSYTTVPSRDEFKAEGTVIYRKR
ncbi:MAG: phage minor head protein [Fibromonadales bacterium]|nr:phage minor head protein [Fibromonadales bacterium]